jgi:hypothetical protein
MIFLMFSVALEGDFGYAFEGLVDEDKTFSHDEKKCDIPLSVDPLS